MRGKTHVAAVVVTAILVALLGSLLLLLTFHDAYRSIRREHNTHLLDIARSTDRNLYTLISRCTDELRYTIADAAEAEDVFVRTGDSRFLQDRLQCSPLLLSAFVDDVIVMRGEENVLSANGGSYVFPYGYDCGCPCICLDGSGVSHLAISQRSLDGALSYAALLEKDAFYRNIVGTELTDDYWLVLYCMQNGLLLQNDHAMPEYKVFSPQEAVARGDSVSILVESENTRSIITREYTFRDQKHGWKRHTIVAALPSSLNNNGMMTIGVTVSNAHILRIFSLIFWRNMFCCILFLSGCAILVVLFLRNRRKNDELREKTRLLREQEASMRNLLETSQTLMHHQRLETIGILTGGVAHEFNNLLTPIMGYSLLSMENLPPDSEELLENLTEIYDASRRAKSLVARMSELSRKGDRSAFRKLSPEEILDKALESAYPVRPKNVEVVRDGKCPDIHILGNETQLIQLFLNIVINAFHALKAKGGTLTVSVTPANEAVNVCLRNDGPLIPEDALPHIFDPFFTTKESGRGTGLGLAIARQIAEAHGGSIAAESGASEGTAFTVTLPRCAD